jgi:hypothetical protein
LVVSSNKTPDFMVSLRAVSKEGGRMAGATCWLELTGLYVSETCWWVISWAYLNGDKPKTGVPA